jgi:hypothetical protein
MHVKIDNIQSQAAPSTSSTVFSRIDTAMKFTVTNSTNANPVNDATNKRAGLFGTALQNDDDDDEGEDEEEEMDVGNNRGASRGKHQKIVFQDSNRKVSSQNSNNRPNRPGGRGQKGNRRSFQKNANNRNENVTMEDLDNDLDNYIAKR